MLKAYKYRLVPTAEQAELINKHIGSCRFVYNLALEVKNYAYATQRKNITCFDLISQLPDLKKECEWLKEIDSQALQQSVINLDKAFTQFFKGHAEFPKFKKKTDVQSFRNPHGNHVEIKDGRLRQPKFKDGIKIILDKRVMVGEIKNTTISRTPTGKYFVSILVDDGRELPFKKPVTEETAVGIDLGIKSFIVTSDGKKVDSQKPLKKLLSKLKHASRQHSKKKKGGKNRKKSQHKLAVLHEKIATQRKDFLHKLSTDLIKNHDTLCLEDLNISGMVKNHKIAQAISDMGWGMFVDFCKYKAEWTGNNILQIPTFEPSSKIHNKCGYHNKDLVLSDRIWLCPKCNEMVDRDLNAAINIKNYCLNNCAGVRREKPLEPPTLVGAVKKEKCTV